MTADGPHDDWPGPDDKLVVDEMLNNRDSPHWGHCRNFIQGLKRIRSLPVDRQEDAIQNAMLAVTRSLPGFRYEGRLRNWLGTVVNTHAIDEYREIKRENQWITRMNDPSEKFDNEGDYLARKTRTSPLTPEEVYLAREKLHEVLTELQAYANTHRHPERICMIVRKVLDEGYSREEIAEQLGISAAMVGYLLRSAQRHLRETMGD